MANKSDISLNSLLSMLIGQSKAEVKIRVKTDKDGVALQVTADDLDITTKAQKAHVEVDGTEIDIDAGNFTLTYDAGAISEFKRVKVAPVASPAAAPAAPVKNRGSGSATNARLHSDLG